MDLGKGRSGMAEGQDVPPVLLPESTTGQDRALANARCVTKTNGREESLLLGEGQHSGSRPGLQRGDGQKSGEAGAHAPGTEAGPEQPRAHSSAANQPSPRLKLLKAPALHI